MVHVSSGPLPQPRLSLALGLVVLLALALAACDAPGGGNTNTLAATVAPGNATATALASQRFKVGDAVNVANTFLITIKSATTSFGSGNAIPKTGTLYVVIDLSIKNISSQRVDVASSLQSALIDPKGRRYSAGPGAFAPRADGRMEVGGKLNGKVTFEVPVAIHQLTFIFEADLISNKQAAWEIEV